MHSSVLEVIRNFRVLGRPVEAERYGRGHIHETYLVRTSETDAHDYILQKINHTVFKDIKSLMENIATVSCHLTEKNGNQRHKALSLVRTNTGETHFYDGNNYWRVFVFIKDSHIYQKIHDTKKAKEAGKAIGDFQFQLSDLEKQLHVIMPGFHDVERRLKEHQEAGGSDFSERRKKAGKELQLVGEHASEMQKYWHILSSSNIPLRVTHNDTKVNNILFDRNDNAVCLIDLDTVMPGFVHFDFGDAVRTIANNAMEDEKDPEKVYFDMDLFESFASGYLTSAKKFIEPSELTLLPFSPLYMTFIIGLRFLTDYLDGDAYYRTTYPDHNLVRARSQFKLLKSMIKRYQEIKEKVNLELV